MKIKALLLLAALASSGLSAAAANAVDKAKPDTPADYAYALPLQVSGRQGVVAYTLPLSVYLKAHTAGLDDLRVFDAQGKPQPFALHRPSPETPAQRSTKTAAIFPVRGLAPSVGSPALAFDIQTRTDGSIVSVQAHAGNAAEVGDKLSALILDFGVANDSRPPRIEALRFASPAGQTNYSAQVWLEASQDLKTWQAIGAAELSWLANDSGQTLANDRLEISPQAFRYARLTWRRGTPAAFAEIHAETVARGEREAARETLWLKPQVGRQPGDLVYTAGIALPVEQISLNFAEANIVYPLTLGNYVERPAVRGGNNSDWVFSPRIRASFYQITQDGETRRSGPLRFGNTVGIGVGHQAEWVIRPQDAALSAQPELGLSWQPATLVFLSGGTPPYTLSFGRSDAQPGSRPLSDVAPGFKTAEIGQLEQAQAGELRQLHAETDTASAAEEAAHAARQRSYILWGVLLAGVAVLGILAWRLVGQMKAGKGP